MRSFIGFGQQGYIGQTFTQPVKLAGIATQVIPLLFNWISYGASTLVPNVNVLVSWDNAACRAMDQVRSIYIDNLGSSNPVYVYFPDTGYSVAAKANSEGWYPAFTNARQCWVIGEGFLTGSIPTTAIILSNVVLPPSVNVEIDQTIALWKASPVITRGTSIYNKAYGTPALGDQASQSSLDMTVLNKTINLFNGPYSSGFITMTGLTINMIACAVNPAQVSGILIESTGVGGTLYSFSFEGFPTASSQYLGFFQLYNKSGLQILLDATQTWRARCISALAQGFAQICVEFTQGPQ